MCEKVDPESDCDGNWLVVLELLNRLLNGTECSKNLKKTARIFKGTVEECIKQLQEAQ